MQLWTDYEGVTLDGAYPLQKLLMPEGRSAFYSTAAPDGERTVLRLIECHFDEEEILARWRSVQALNHPNFLKFVHFGQTELDGRPVVYAVFEKVDANLAEVLDRGSLPVEDVAKIGSSLVAALDVLHTHGFIHEHVEPRNIFAIDDTVKLRSDCIREAPEGVEGRAAKQRDVRDLATVLLQALTQQTSIDGIPDSALPRPFHQIIRKGLDGTWGLEDIRTALETRSPAKPTPAPPLQRPPAPAAPLTAPKAPAAAKPPMPPEPQLPLPQEELNTRYVRASTRIETRDDRKEGTFHLNSRTLAIAGIGALLVLFLLWLFAHPRDASTNQPTQPAAASPSATPPSMPSSTVASAPQPSPQAEPRPIPPPAIFTSGWRVIAFTYNRRADAERKVASIAHSHRALNPAVFTPSGGSPYFVSVGGVMDQRTASALAHRSRSLGLPRDTFARNYSR